MVKRIIKTKAVIFDMDGVITNTMPDHYRVWRRVFKEEGIYVTHLDVYRREGQPGINSVLEIFSEKNRAINHLHAKKILNKKERLFKGIVKRRFITGARRLLRTLHKDGFKLALVTGTSRDEFRRILPGYLCNLFDVIVTGSDVYNGKPHPEPYRRALKKLEVRPKDALVIENAPFGIQSAKSARIRCLAIETSLPKDYLIDANAIFSSIKDLQNKVILKKL